MLDQLLKWAPAEEGRPLIAIEAVGTMGGANNAVQTQGSLLRSLGAIETVAECLKWTIDYVQPMTWKRSYGLVGLDLPHAKVKAKSLEVARKLYPDAAHDLRLQKFHNRAEAILLAHWQLRLAA